MDFANTVTLALVLDELRAYFKTNKASCYLVAVSGGKDSMLLCELMRRLTLPFEVVHVNYGLRGEQSEADQAFVEAYCLQYNLPLHIKRAPLAAILQQHNKNLQAEARRIRYAFFSEIQQQRPDSLICTAHHAADQVETFWLQLARGAGLKGLAAMAFSQKGLLRPLLNLGPETLHEVALELELKWREDSSNTTLKYRRNLWRHVFIPFLKDKLPLLEQSILLIQKQFATEMKAQEDLLHSALEELKINKSINLSKIAQLSSYQFVELFKLFGLPPHVIRRLPDLFSAENGKSITWQQTNEPQKSFVVKQNNQLVFLTEATAQWTYEIEALTPNLIDLALHSKNIIDLQQIEGALYFRFVAAGDRMPVVGMKGSKKVLQILKEAGYAAPLRKKQYVLCDQQKIVAIPNLQLNAVVVATEHTTHFALLHFLKKP